MMPRRWLEPDSEATEVERSLLTLSPDPEPGPGEQERIWERLLASIPGPTNPDGSAPAMGSPPSGAGASGAATAAALGAGLHKTVSLGTLLGNHGLGFAVGVVTTTLVFLLVDPLGSREDAAPSSTATSAEPAAPRAEAVHPEVAPSSTPIEELQLERPDSSPVTVPRVTPTAPPAASAPPPRSASQLSEEAALLREARSRLAHGDLEGANEVLAVSKAKFPNPRLAQEREAATIELLRRSGDGAGAAARARAFLSKYPKSPHARQVERALPTQDTD